MKKFILALTLILTSCSQQSGDTNTKKDDDCACKSCKCGQANGQ